MMAWSTLVFLICSTAHLNVVLSDSMYYITPTSNVSCPSDPCFSLSEIAANFSSVCFSHNDTLLKLNLLPGTHTLDVTLNISGNFPFSMVGLTHNVIITCNFNGMLMVVGANNVTISGLKFVDCKSHKIVAARYLFVNNCSFVSHFGSAIHLVNSTITMMRAEFISNSVGGQHGRIKLLPNKLTLVGSAIYAFGSSVTILDSIFEDNCAEIGGAIFGEFHSIFIIINGTFLNNYVASSDCNGGVMYMESECSADIINCYFRNNSARGRYADGGVFAVTESTLRVNRSVFELNEAFTSGGVVYTIKLRYAKVDSQIIISNSNFTENYASFGGAIYTQKVMLTVANVRIIGCVAESGGAMYIIANIISITGCTLINNTATEYGGALHIVTAKVTVSNSTLNGNSAEYGGAMNIQYVNVNFSSSCDLSDNFASVQGGVIYAYVSIVYLTQSIVSGNIAYRGGVLDAQSESWIFTSEVVLKNNIGILGILYITESNGNFSHGTTITANNGSLILTYGSAYFRGNIAFSHCTSLRSNVKYAFQRGSAINAFRSLISFEGKSSFTHNLAESGGALYAVDSSIAVLGEMFIAHNKARDTGGGIYLYQSSLDIGYESILNLMSNRANKRGGGIHAVSSFITAIYDLYFLFSTYLGSRVILRNNSAEEAGGGMYLELNSRLNILMRSDQSTKPELYYVLTFTENSAAYGGAIYIADDTNPEACTGLTSDTNFKASIANECFLQVLILDQTDLPLPNQIISFFQNRGLIRGSILFGGLLDRCILSTFSRRLNYSSKADGTSSVPGITLFTVSSKVITDTEVSPISSNPVKVCFCKSGRPKCTGYQPSVHVKKGERFSIDLVAVDQANNIINKTKIHSSLTLNSTQGGLGEGQLIQSTQDGCSSLNFTVFSPHQFEDLVLYAEGPCKDASISQKQLSVRFLPCSCSIGFEPDLAEETTCACKCDSVISMYITNCEPQTKSLIKDTNLWIDVIDTTTNRSWSYPSTFFYVIYPHCPLDYCNSSVNQINLNIENGADKQCAFNRSGLLCGSCKRGLSLSLGSSRCIKCPNNWLTNCILILVGALLAGIILVCLILLLNLTVAVGTLNGIIFYANIVNANSSTFFPFSTPNIITIFISWLNLELGFDICFFEGMDTYWKIWLHIVFPVYLIFLVILIIIFSESSTKFAQLIGKKNPVATLDTLILLSYAKLLRMIISVLSFATPEYLTSTIIIGTSKERNADLVWLSDASVKYLGNKHVPLFIVALLILIFGIIYTVILFSWQWLLRYQNASVLKLIRFQKFQLIVEPYHAPYTFRHRYWTGLLFLIRVILYITSAVNVSKDPGVNLLAIGIVMVGTVFLAARYYPIYRHWPVEAIEITCYLNILLFCLSKLYVLEADRDQNAIAYLSGSTTLCLFVGVIAYHIYTEFLQNQLKRLFLKLKNRRQNSVHERDLVTNVSNNTCETNFTDVITCTVIEAPARGEQPLSTLIEAGKIDSNPKEENK